MPTETAAVLSEPSLNQISIQAIRTAARAIAPYVVRTPTLPLDRLSADLGRPVVGKFELLQHTGSFKVRGAFHRMQQLTEAERAAGVVAVSGGNHGLAVAYAARVLGIEASVIMPATAAPASVEQVRADGAHLILMDTIAEVFARSVAEVEAGKVLVHPFDDAGGGGRAGHRGPGAARGRPGDHRRPRLGGRRRADHRRGGRAQGARPGDPGLGGRDRGRRRDVPLAPRR